MGLRSDGERAVWEKWIINEFVGPLREKQHAHDLNRSIEVEVMPSQVLIT